MSFDSQKGFKDSHKLDFNPFGTGQCLSTYKAHVDTLYDISIPLEQGNVFRHYDEQNDLWQSLSISIPLEQGNVFRQITTRGFGTQRFQSLWNRAMSFDDSCCRRRTSNKDFNPFGTGQCLSTFINFSRSVLNKIFQSLWNRAMSFDAEFKGQLLNSKKISIPLEQGNVFRQYSRC